MIPKLEIDRVSYSYHSSDSETLALDHISLDMSSGELLAIMGPLGCGKSALLSMLCGLVEPGGGTITIDDVPLTKSPSATGYMLQKDYLSEWRNTFFNISLGLEIQRRLDESARQELLEMMATYSLADFGYAKPSELSSGMHQKAALARILALKPDLLLLDESFSVLDCQTRLSVCDDISSIICQIHRTAMLVTHDLSGTISMADRILVLSPRPGWVKKVLSIGFPENCIRSLDCRNCPESSTYFNVIWKGLETYGQR